MSERPFRLTDTLTRQVRELKPQEPKHLKFYSCGPTVYSYSHIGNFRSFLTADLVVRTALALGWKVTWVSNITDVGHLTQDDMADATGEDKMDQALHSKEGEKFNNVWELAEFYTQCYDEDWRKLNLIEPDVRPKATQHVREQILAIQALIENGHAYETPTGVYFAVSSFEHYGDLSGNRDQDSLARGVRDVVQDENKRHPADFAVWKKDDKHLMQWFSPFGWGFPGWHIECSVMARAYLGDTIDLHSGGEDNIFPHHECEIAQSESLTGKTFSHHWLHTRFLLVDGEKMSKSKGNFYTVRDLLARGVDPLAIRYALISGTYSKQLNFTMQGLEDAARNVERFQRAESLALVATGMPERGRLVRQPVTTIAERPGETPALRQGGDGPDVLGKTLTDLADQTLDAMANDLNVPVALAKALEGAKLIAKEGEGMSAPSAKSALAFLDRINDLLGIVRSEYDLAPEPKIGTTPQLDPTLIEAKIVERREAKAAKDFALADAVRKGLQEKGVTLTDHPDGSTTWSAG